MSRRMLLAPAGFHFVIALTRGKEHSMKARGLLLAFLAGLMFASRAPAQVMSLSTIFAANNNNSVGGGNYYNVDVLNAAGITITAFDINTNAAAGTPVTINVWTRPGTHVGFETSMAGWTQVTTGSGVAAGDNLPTFIDVTDFALSPGLTGFALNNTNVAFRYTNGTGTNQFYSNSDLSLTLGSATNVFLTAPVFTPRVWNGTVYYTTVPEPGTLLLTGLVLTAGAGWRRLRKK
jgi:hypothetical protein